MKMELLTRAMDLAEKFIDRVMDLADKFFVNEEGGMRMIMGIIASVLLIIAVTLLFMTFKVTAG